MVSAIVVAGGKGKRMGKQISKQYLKICGIEIIAITLSKFEKCKCIDNVVLVVPEQDVEFCNEKIIKKYGFKKVIKVVKGGDERQDSVYNGLLNIPKDTDIVVIHDGVRPFVSSDIIEKSIEEAEIYGACGAAVAVKDTIKIADENRFVKTTPERKNMFAIQTPQSFKYDVILNAHETAKKSGKIYTDDTKLVEEMGLKVKLFEGSYSNIKITTPEDLYIGEYLYKMEEKKN